VGRDFPHQSRPAL